MLALMLSLPALLLPAGASRPALATRSALPSVARRTSVPAAAAAAAAMEVLYDSQCMVCLTNKKLLTWFDRGREKVSFVVRWPKTHEEWGVMPQRVKDIWTFGICVESHIF